MSLKQYSINNEPANCYVITIETNSESIKASERCISSANQFGLDTEIFNAYTPRHDPLKILEGNGINTKGFHRPSHNSYIDAAAGCFLSHFTLWKKCIEINKLIIIFEHDAIIINEIPFNILDGIGFDKLINLGEPAHGSIKTPKFIGVGLLQSSNKLYGSHAYAVKPAGALELINKAKTHANPVDLFLNIFDFPFLEELYPWPVITELKFSTIQTNRNAVATNIQLDEYGKARE